MLSRSHEHTLHAAPAQASLLRHQYVTLGHLLVALLNDHDAAPMLSMCRVNQEQFPAHLMEAMTEDLAAPVGRQQHNPLPTTGF